jgi:predicted amidohydrolase
MAPPSWTFRAIVVGLAPVVWVIAVAQGAMAAERKAPPLIHEAQLLGRGDLDATRAQLGYAVSVSGDTAVVGSVFEDTPAGVSAGAAHVFVRSGTTWIEQQRLLPGDGAANDLFGCAVSVSGDTLVVGAFGHDTGGAGNAGSAYVFVRSGDTWSQEAELVAPVGEVQDGFGYAVAVSGDTAIVGAVDDDTPGGKDAGSAYVFVRSGAVWALQQQLEASDPEKSQLFGAAVSIEGDTAVVGAPLDPENGLEAGAAYVFVRSGTTWTEQQKLLASDGAEADLLGISVSLSGDTAVAGALGADTAGGVDAGAAYVFVRSGTAWTEQQKLVALDGATLDGFGISTSVAGDRVLVGAWSADTPAGPAAGAAYVFVGSGATWSEEQKILPGDGAPNDAFAYAVSLSGDTAIVGARLGDTADGVDAGSAYVFVRAGTTWSRQQKLLGSETPRDGFGGVAVSVSGDTAVVGARLADTPAGADAGSAYVFVRSGAAWSLQQKLLASDGAALDSFGTSVSVSGDTVIVGAPVADTVGGVDAGAAYAFVRSGTTWTEQQKLLPPDGRANLDFGFAASLSGDTVVIGAPSDDTLAGINTGSAYVFVRSGTTWAAQEKLLAPDAAEGDDFGFAVSASGDTVAVGAFAADTATTVDGGSAYVFVRSGTTWSLQQKLLASDAASGDYFGLTVSVFGDALAVGAVLHDTPAGVDAGAAYVFARSGGTWTELRELTAPDGMAGDFFGKSVALSGDTVVAGAPGDDTVGGMDAGSAQVFRGSVPVELQSFTVE